MRELYTDYLSVHNYRYLSKNPTDQLLLQLVVEDCDLQGDLFTTNNRVGKIEWHKERLEHLYLGARKITDL